MWKTIKIILIFVILAAVSFFIFKGKGKNKTDDQVKEAIVKKGTIESVISTTGTVLPKNRLEIKPPVNGRIEQILVQEGENVKIGQTLALMSSTERAAILDAARSKGEEELKYWQEAYKPILLISPIDGEVIVAKTQPGQTITTGDAVVVLSDHLIARAQVDETDIGKIKDDQIATIILDAYPDAKIKGRVEHIYYESKTVNNVTIYEVDVVPETIPSFFRSGMNATIDFRQNYKENVLILPQDAVYRDKDQAWVLLKQNSAEDPIKRLVKVGIMDDKNIEIISGVEDGNVLIVRSKKYALPKANSGTNPFMPGRRR